MQKICTVGSVRLGAKALAFILGPCVIESEGLVRNLARDLDGLCRELDVPFVFKASYDKANRTSGRAFRGVGLAAGVELLADVGRALDRPVTTDVHTAEEARVAGRYVDLLQIPAFLCRQTDLLRAAAETGRPVNVKKGQFLAPWDVAQIAAKLDGFGCQNYCFTERGTTFGYGNLVADMRSLPWIRGLGYPIIFDATHSVQRPGGAGDRSGGDGELAPALARAAVAAGCDGVFLETHYEPSAALSDGPNQVPFADLPKLLRQLKVIHEVVA